MGRASAIYRSAAWISTHAGSRGGLSCLERLADGRWCFAARLRRVVAENLSLVLEPGAAHRPETVREVFRNFGRYLVEFFRMHQEHPQVNIEGETHLANLRDCGRGAIVLTAHLGNWEFGAVVLQRLGYQMKAVALPHHEARLNELFNTQRRRCGLDVIPLGPGAARQSLRVLRQGAWLGLLGDRAMAGRELRVRFGRGQMTVPAGPAILSLRSGAPVVPMFFIREAPWQFRLYVEPPMYPTRDRAEVHAVATLTQAYTAIIERYVQQFATQWLMFQPLGEIP